MMADNRVIEKISRKPEYNLTEYINLNIQRLESIDTLLNEKIHNLEDYANIDKLINLQTLEVERLKKTLTNKITQPSSKTNASLRDIFNKYFS